MILEQPAIYKSIRSLGNTQRDIWNFSNNFSALLRGDAKLVYQVDQLRKNFNMTRIV